MRISKNEFMYQTNFYAPTNANMCEKKKFQEPKLEDFNRNKQACIMNAFYFSKELFLFFLN
jgi:hypothetical protein